MTQTVELPEDVREAIRDLATYPCVCIDAYKNRGLADPNCIHCEIGHDVDILTRWLDSLDTAEPADTMAQYRRIAAEVDASDQLQRGE